MEGADGSPPPSLCIVRTTEFFPRSNMEKEDPDLEVPYQELAGEFVLYLGRTDDGILSLSTYRIFMLKNSTNSEISVPLGLIESLHIRDLFHLIISCKDASTVKCSFATAEQCAEWLRRIQLCVGVPETLESLFAFPFHSYMSDAINMQSEAYNAPEYLERLQRAKRGDEDFMREVIRLGFDLNGTWRISKANEDFKLCPSYPQKLLVPACISDDMLYEVSKFRGSRRLPAVVWRHKKSGAVIARCSQPEVGWFGWRNNTDEQLLKALSEACAFDRGEQMRRQNQATNTAAPRATSGESSPSSTDGGHVEVTMDEVQKVLIIDARSYASAVTNRARGGGCECIEYYPSAEIEFMNLGNIHVIRRSFQALRQLCASPADSQNWLGMLEKTGWLLNLSGLLTATVTVCRAIEKKGKPVLVHCSDGWDRTPQIVATAQLCLDPYYRTVEGFRVLVEREWLSFGHKFSDRCGHGPGSDEQNERCPVFLQWLDMVHQIHKQFPCSFEFNMAYLIKLAQHSLSCLFGTFLCNTYKERCEKSVFERTYSVWPFLSGPMYKSPLYIPNKDQVIWAAHNVRDLYLWTDVYLGSLGNQNSIDFVENSNENLQGTATPMTKTRSYGDLVSANIMQSGISRRSSDPNMTVEPNLTMATNSESNSIADTRSERDDLPDNEIDTTMQRIENAGQLNNPDAENLMNVANTLYETSATINTQPIELHETLTNTEETLRQDNATAVTALSNNERQNDNANDATVSREVRDSGGGDKENEFTTNTNEDLMISIELSDASQNIAENTDRDSNWHSTDTLVPNTNRAELSPAHAKVEGDTMDDSFHTPEKLSTSSDREELGLSSPYVLLKQQNRENTTTSGSHDHRAAATSVNNSIMPNVHGTNGTSNRANHLSNSSSNASVSSASSSLNNLNNINNTNSNSNSNNSLATTMTTATDQSANDVDEVDAEAGAAGGIAHADAQASHDAMNESIIILPEHRNLQISASGKCEAMSNSGSSLPTSPIDADEKPNTSRASAQNSRSDDVWSGGVAGSARKNDGGAGDGASGSAAGGAAGAGGGDENTQRRRRPSSSNSYANRYFEGINLRQPQNAGIPRFHMPGARSLPMTPPPQQERPQMTYSCPDGLAHALSEQNMRLQQIVLEHRLREDMLLREIHDMRMILLKKRCPNCNVAQTSEANEEQCSAADNLENASICSWEAVEDRSAPSSSASSSIQQPNTTSALWVPDHAVKRCTSCQVEFWIGRRKHHCRSCGQIFCADCSEFWAPLPDAKLFKPVRLCGPCYLAVTTRIEQQSNAIIATNMPNYTATTNSITSAAAAAWTPGGAAINSPKIAPAAAAAATLSNSTTTRSTTPASCATTATVLQQQQQQQQRQQQQQPKQRHYVATASATTNGTFTNLQQPVAVHGGAVGTANTPATSALLMAPIPMTAAAAAAADALQQQQHRQNAAAAAATASATVAVAAAESSSMSHILMAANKNIAASVAN